MTAVAIRSTPRPAEHRTLGLVAIAGVILVVGGLAGGVTGIVAMGALALGICAVATAVLEPVAFLLIFVALRPMLDIGPTYGRGPDLNSAAAILVVVAMASWVHSHRGALIRPSAGGWAAAAFAVAAGLSAWGAPSLGWSVGFAFRVGTVSALFLFGQQIVRFESRLTGRLVAAVLVSVSLTTAMAVLQIIDLIPLPAEYRGIDTSLDLQLLRPPGPFPAPTVLGAHICIGVAMLLYLLPRAWRSPRWRAFVPHLAVLFAVFGWVLFENKSRGSLLGVVIVVAIVCTTRWRAIGVALFALPLLLGVATLTAADARLDEVSTSTTPGAEADTFAWRMGYCSATFRACGTPP